MSDNTEATAGQFKLSSSDIGPNGSIPMRHVFKGFSCEGENISPDMSWTNAPPGTRSFSLLVHDPDAPTGGAGWWHWVVCNIPVGVSGLPQGAGKEDGSAMVLGAMQIATDYGIAGWGGPCPPVGDSPHHYHFTLYALGVDKLDIPPGATASLVGFMVNANALGKARLTGLFGRSA